MTQKKAAASAEKRAKAAKPENTRKKHALTPAMEARKWKAGESGNPGGRPKRDQAADIAQFIMEAAADPKNLQAITQAMLKKLRKGDVKVFSALAERGYGKSPQPIEQSGEVTHRLILENIDVAEQESA